MRCVRLANATGLVTACRQERDAAPIAVPPQIHMDASGATARTKISAMSVLHRRQMRATTYTDSHIPEVHQFQQCAKRGTSRQGRMLLPTSKQRTTANNLLNVRFGALASGYKKAHQPTTMSRLCTDGGYMVTTTCRAWRNVPISKVATQPREIRKRRAHDGVPARQTTQETSMGDRLLAMRFLGGSSRNTTLRAC